MRLPAKIVLAAAIGMVLYVSFSVGQLSGLAKATRRAAENDADTLFALAKEGELDIAKQLHLLDLGAEEALLEEEKVAGAIRSFRRLKTTRGLYALPVMIEVEVVRVRATRRVLVVRHASASPKLLVYEVDPRR